ncbi:hypothetical protein QOT17_001850 [Balamuthia mandrillaris]
MQKRAEEFLRFVGEEGFQNGLMSDVTLRLPDHPDLSLHSLVLCQSGYFRAGLNFRLRSGQDANARPLVLDLDRNAFVGRITPASVFECVKALYGLVDLNNEELFHRLCDPQYGAVRFSSPVEASPLSSSSSSATVGSKRKREEQEDKEEEEKEEQNGKRMQPSLYSLFETAVFLSLDWLTDFCVAQMLRYHLSKESKGANTLLLHEMYEKYGQQLPKLKEGFEENLTKLVVVFCEGLFHKHADYSHKDEAEEAAEKEKEEEEKEKERENATKKPRRGYVAGDDSVLHKNLLFQLPAELVVKAISKFPFLKRHEHKKYQILKAYHQFKTQREQCGEVDWKELLSTVRLKYLPSSILKEASWDGILVDVGVLQQEELAQRILEKEDQESRTTTWKGYVDLGREQNDILDPPLIHMGIEFNVGVGIEEFHHNRTHWLQTVTLSPRKPNMKQRRRKERVRISSTRNTWRETDELEDFTEEEKRKIEAWEKHKDSIIKVTITGKDNLVIQQEKGRLHRFEMTIYENEEDLGEEHWRISVVTLPSPPPAAPAVECDGGAVGLLSTFST